MSTRTRGLRNYPRFDPDRRSRELKQNFQVVSKRSLPRRSSDWTRFVEGPMFGFTVMLVVLVGFIFYRWVWNSNLWPSNKSLLQSTYVRDCADARRLGVVPLYSFSVGYRESLDRDRDGIACEPYPF